MQQQADVLYDSRDTRRAGWVEALEVAYAVADDVAREGGDAWLIAYRLEQLADRAKR